MAKLLPSSESKGPPSLGMYIKLNLYRHVQHLFAGKPACHLNHLICTSYCILCCSAPYMRMLAYTRMLLLLLLLMILLLDINGKKGNTYKEDKIVWT